MCRKTICEVKALSLFMICCVVISLICAGCGKSNNSDFDSETIVPANPATPAYSNLTITTDKAVYKPGDEVNLSMDPAGFPSGARVRYKYLHTVVEDLPLGTSKWKWKSPATDFRGYLAEIYTTTGSDETIQATTAIDVSSDWKKFPRYGFLSKFPVLSDATIAATIENLNRYHLNGLQFYDWHNKHHMPLPLVGGAPSYSWKDIINRDNYLATIQKYIQVVHSYNMKAMFYNLVYGAWDNAETDGVQKEWYIFNDPTHVNRDFHALSAPFLSNIYLLDPSNTSWQQYMVKEIRKVYQFLDFDGFHMDQLGDRGSRYKYDGTFLNLSTTFKAFIEAVKADAPQKYNVMNAVQQYGQKGIAESSTDFLYTEVWSPYDSYADLSNLILQNNTLCNNAKNSVMAAYINYDLANAKGSFNTPSVLMANSVIFAFGGAHLELGEHMLGKEYFPNNNLAMKDDLKNALLCYYDFLVAYQNMLRDGGTFNSVALASTDNRLNLQAWPASQGGVAFFGKKLDGFQVIHLINFTNSTTQNWRDNGGIQTNPVLISNANLSLTTEATVKKIWVASPDIAGGVSRTINFQQHGNKVNFTLPELKYWSMLVVE